MIPSMYETVKFYQYGGIISRSDLRWLPPDQMVHLILVLAILDTNETGKQ